METAGDAPYTNLTGLRTGGDAALDCVQVSTCRDRERNRVAEN
jgi:hypothetical protein